MALRFQALLTLSLMVLAAGGCSMMPFGRDEPTAMQPPPLTAAPTGAVTGATLPPPGPTDPSLQNPSGLAALDPTLQSTTTPGTTTPAAMTPAATTPGAVQLGRTDLLGGWTINAAGESCQLFMTLTTWAGGYRASTRGCTGGDLQTISAWNMEGTQVQLLNDTGATVARLSPSSRTQFSGQTSGGGPISVSR